MSSHFLLDIFSKPFTFNGFLGILLGPLLAWLGCRIADAVKSNTKHSFHMLALLIVMLIYFIGFVSVKQEQNAFTVQELSQSVIECEQQFHDTLIQRAKDTESADMLGDERDQAATDWLSALQSPPENIVHLSFDDPVRRQWLRELAGEYQAHILDVQNKRKTVLKARSEKPYPEPTCGKH